MRRLLAVTASSVVCVATLALGGCGRGQDCEPEPAGEAGVSIGVTRGEGVDQHLVAEITDWRVAPHPQVPTEGDRIFFEVQVTPVPGYYVVDSDVALQACAIDAQRVVLACGEVLVEVAADGSATTTEGDLVPANTAATEHVVLLSNRLDGGGHGCDDPKDFDGYNPPRVLSPGSRL